MGYSPWVWSVAKRFSACVFQTFCTITIRKFHQRCARLISLLLYLMHKQEMFYNKECGMPHGLSPFKKTFCVVFQELPMVFWHMLGYVDRFRCIQFSYMGCYTLTMIKNFDAVLSRTDIYLFTNKFIWHRILAIFKRL